MWGTHSHQKESLFSQHALCVYLVKRRSSVGQRWTFITRMFSCRHSSWTSVWTTGTFDRSSVCSGLLVSDRRRRQTTQHLFNIKMFPVVKRRVQELEGLNLHKEHKERWRGGRMCDSSHPPHPPEARLLWRRLCSRCFCQRSSCFTVRWFYRGRTADHLLCSNSASGWFINQRMKSGYDLNPKVQPDGNSSENPL